MTRARKADVEELRRAYVFSADPDISYTKVAQQFGLARSGVAKKGEDGHWVADRQEFINNVMTNTRVALSESWATMETQYRDKLLSIAVRSVENYEKQLDDGEIKVSPKDAAMWVSLARLLLEDAKIARIPDSREPEADITLTEDQFREVYEKAKGLLGEPEEEVMDAPIPLLRSRASG